MNIIIEVENIRCSGCVHSITDKIMENKNVTKVIIDKENQLVKIDLIDSEPRTNFVNQLATLGYPEKGNNSLGAKVKSYVSCAIGKI